MIRKKFCDAYCMQHTVCSIFYSSVYILLHGPGCIAYAAYTLKYGWVNKTNSAEVSVKNKVNLIVSVLVTHLTCCSPYPAYPGLPKFLFAILKFGFNNLKHLSYHILLPTNKGTSSLRKSVLILTRSDFEEVNVVTC